MRAAAEEAPSRKAEHKNFVKSVGEGVWESVQGMGKLLSQPAGQTAFQTLSALISDPKQFGKDVVDWDNWVHDPGKAIGHLLPDAALGAATGGGGAVAKHD